MNCKGRERLAIRLCADSPGTLPACVASIVQIVRAGTPQLSGDVVINRQGAARTAAR